MKEYVIEMDDLSIGLTQPSTFYGVPLVAFYFSILLCSMGWMFTQMILGSSGLMLLAGFACIWAMMFATMYFLTLHDPYGLSIFWLNITTFRPHTNRGMWAYTDSFAA